MEASNKPSWLLVSSCTVIFMYLCSDLYFIVWIVQNNSIIKKFAITPHIKCICSFHISSSDYISTASLCALQVWSMRVVTMGIYPSSTFLPIRRDGTIKRLISPTWKSTSNPHRRSLNQIAVDGWVSSCLKPSTRFKLQFNRPWKTRRINLLTTNADGNEIKLRSVIKTRAYKTRILIILKTKCCPVFLVESQREYCFGVFLN